MKLETLTPQLQRAIDQLPPKRLGQVSEIRLRMGYPVKLVLPWGEEMLTDTGQPIPVTNKLLRELVDRATGFSPYALRGEESGLYLPLERGCRMGLCGEAVIQDGVLRGIRQISSIVIRLAREYKGVAETAVDRLLWKGTVQSALIVSPPGRGKTTFLRDLIRCVSLRGYRVSVVDERRELAAARAGVPQLDLGPTTDILTGCPKGEAIRSLIRVMNPQVLALDELAGQRELQLAQEASYSGIALFATAHGDGIASLLHRPGYRELLASGAFSWCITLYTYDSFRMERLGSYAENHGSLHGGGGVVYDWSGCPAGNQSATADAAAAQTGAGADAGGDGAAYAARQRVV